ncbi:hypothetical protein Bbelb_276790 [Branchiostoma belcheri]|nr:hypothetical protein Bbelb_276790 [Branchiostoma belcheri]
MEPNTAANNGYSDDEVFYADNSCRGGSNKVNDFGRQITQPAASKVFTTTAVVASTAIIKDATRAVMGSEDCGNYGGGECEGSYGECGGRGNGDNLGRDEDSDFALEAITRGSRDDGCDCGDEISYGDGDGRGGIDNPGHDAMVQKTVAITATAGAKGNCRGDSDNPGRDDWGDVALKPITAVALGDAMVRKMATAWAKVLQATAVIAVTATIQDATREVMVPKTLAITATTAAKFLTAPAGSDGSQDFVNYGDSGCKAGEVTAVVGRSDDAENCGNYGDSFYSDRGGRGDSDYPGLDEGGKVALEAMTAVVAVTKVADGSDGAKDFGNSDGSGCEASEVTAVVDGSDDPGRVEGSDVALEAITAAVVDGAEDCSNYAKIGENFVTVTAVVAAVVDNPRRDESDDVT